MHKPSLVTMVCLVTAAVIMAGDEGLSHAPHISQNLSGFFVRRRKAGHATTFPLSPQVGAALLDYLRAGRPPTTDRQVFRSVLAPFAPTTMTVVSQRAG